ncbi:hypothetical protein ACVDG3_14675 [Meridianimarinicoccus sp. RP-17]|uniref:hypothetical protein n=1 Tax=Meridianimarinicoccus zhengii TaxID=2056810 RepID=UPI000DAE133C|nr:hypothetical protein [Phycocomes zhengii]
MESTPENKSSETSHVWVGSPGSDSSLLFGFTCALADKDNDALVANIRAFKRGIILEEGALPATMWIDEQRAEYDRRTLPHLLSAAGFLAVSDAFAEVLSGFDLGRTQLRPVALLKSDRKTPFSGTYFFLNIGEVHKHFAPEYSTRFMPMPKSRSSYIAGVSPDLRDGDISVAPGALTGPDLWHDDTLSGSLFLSDRLVTALRAAKLTRRLPLARCPVVNTT